MSETGHAIEVIDVWKKYGDVTALRGVSITVNEGEVVSLLGPNGAGKTTLISIVVGILRPTKGKILIYGRDPRDPKVRSIIGFCPQEPALNDNLTGRENMMFYARLYGIDGDEAKRRINELLEMVGLLDDADRLVGKYSGGMKRRLSLAITLIHDPKILVLDEPTLGMDPRMRRDVWNIVREAKRRGKSVLLATHYMEEADELSDRVYIIHEGKIIAEGSPEQLKKVYGPPSVIEIELYKTVSKIEEEIKSVVKSEIIAKDKQIRVHSRAPDADVPKIVSCVYKAGGEIKNLRVTKPTLEDVFLRLTGRRLEE
ncbi:MAG: ABC transporter ATP-binding protein [Thermoprotei archaeon]|nr:MAG: ABC transporter ATP-binding protein [Thermoprotei archaeon]